MQKRALFTGVALLASASARRASSHYNYNDDLWRDDDDRSGYDDDITDAAAASYVCACSCLGTSYADDSITEVSTSVANCTTCTAYCETHLGCVDSSGNSNGGGFSVECSPEAWWPTWLLLAVIGGTVLPAVCWLCGLAYFCHDAKMHPGRPPRGCFTCCWPLCAVYAYDGGCAVSTWFSLVMCCIFWPATWCFANCCWAPREAYYTRHYDAYKPPDAQVAYNTVLYSGGSGYSSGYTGDGLGSFAPPLQQSPPPLAYAPPQVVLAVAQDVYSPAHAQQTVATAEPLKAYVVE
jgi:hypothetical protein